MSVSIAVVCEAVADFQTIATLADRLILLEHRRREPSPWIDEETIHHYRRWRGFASSDHFLQWTAAKRIADELGIVPRFRPGRPRPQHDYAFAGLRASLVLARSPEPARAAILVPDADNSPSRLSGLDEVRTYLGEANPLPLAIGQPVTKRECWHLCGFQPENNAEHEAADRLHSELGNDPWFHTHELTASHDHDKRSAKRVLSALCGGDRERELRCLHAPLDLLRQRGGHNGLAAFLTELETHIVPLVLGQPR